MRYIEVLPKLVHAYNRSYHRSIKRSPAEVNPNNQEDVWQILYGHLVKKQKPTSLKPGDRVRISKNRRVFKKGYLPSWSEELFTISRVNNTNPLTYVLKDDHGEELLGSFYHQEIQKVGTKDVFRIESILKERNGPTGGKHYLVKWFGYPSTFNSWISATSLTKYAN